jgi:hypothetical protein
MLESFEADYPNIRTDGAAPDMLVSTTRKNGGRRA